MVSIASGTVRATSTSSTAALSQEVEQLSFLGDAVYPSWSTSGVVKSPTPLDVASVAENHVISAVNLVVIIISVDT